MLGGQASVFKQPEKTKAVRLLIWVDLPIRLVVGIVLNRERFVWW